MRGNILPGVLSVRLGLKQRMAVAERTVDHAERMNALWSRHDDSAFLSLAWHKIIESSAHDSVVGSGTDETCDQVAARLAEAAQTARAVRDAALAEPAALVPSDGHLVANPLPFERTALVEVNVVAPPEGTSPVAAFADGSEHPVQLISRAPTVLSDERMDAAQVERVLRRIHRRELFGRLIDHYDLSPGSLVFHLAEVPSGGPFDLLILRKEVAAAAAAHPGEWRVLTLEEARATALVPVRVPASGLTSFRVGTREEASVAPDTDAEPADPNAPVSAAYAPAAATGRTLSNGLVTVTVATDGTLDITGPDGTLLSGVGRLVDGGDRGDSYNYAPPAHDVLVREPTQITVDLVEDGPLRSRLRVTRVYAWPAALSDNRDLRDERTLPTPVEMLVEVRTGEPFVRLSTAFLNRSADHRLRLHVPLPEPVGTSSSAGQFAVTERGLTAEGGWGEHPLPTFPASTFVSAGPASVFLDHSSEYELVDGGSELALTLLRAIGSISVNIHPLRDEPAASEIPAPGAQDLGMRIENRFAVVPSADGWRGARAVALAEEFRNDVLVTRGTAPATAQLPPDATGLRVDGQDVLVSSVRRVTDDASGAGIEVRLAAMRDTASTVRVTGAFSEAVTVDLLGRPIARAQAENVLELALGAWEIRTVVLR